MPTVIRSIDIAASPRAVWAWFTSQASLREWIAPDLEIDLVVGGAYSMRPDGETLITGTVLELEPERRLVLSWLENAAGWAQPARLLLLVEPIDGGTRALVQHDGFNGIGRADWPEVEAAYERGADTHRILDRLAALATGAE